MCWLSPLTTLSMWVFFVMRDPWLPCRFCRAPWTLSELHPLHHLRQQSLGAGLSHDLLFILPSKERLKIKVAWSVSNSSFVLVPAQQQRTLINRRWHNAGPTSLTLALHSACFGKTLCGSLREEWQCPVIRVQDGLDSGSLSCRWETCSHANSSSFSALTAF